MIAAPHRVADAVRRRLRRLRRLGANRSTVLAHGARDGLRRGMLGLERSLPTAWLRRLPLAPRVRSRHEAVASARARMVAWPVADGPIATGRRSIAVIVHAATDPTALETTVASLRRQTRTGWHCYVIDDAASDDLEPVLDRHAAGDERFTLSRHARAGGPIAAWNTGVRLAREPVTVRLVAGERLAPDAIERVMRRAEAEPADATLAGWTWWASGWATPGPDDLRATSFTWGDDGAHLDLDRAWLRTEVIRAAGGFDETAPAEVAEAEFVHRLLRHGYWLAVGPAPWHDGSGPRPAERAGVAGARESWAELEPGLAVADASMPYTTAAASVGVLRAAVRSIEIDEIAPLRSTSPEPADDVTGADARTAHSGWLRYEIESSIHARLGLDPVAVGVLGADDRGRIARRATELAARLDDLAAHPPPGATEPTESLRLGTGPDVLFVAETAADVAFFAPLADELATAGVAVAALDLDLHKGDEGGGRWTSVTVVPLNHLLLRSLRPSVTVARGPLGHLAAEVVRHLGGAHRIDEPDRGLGGRDDDRLLTTISRTELATTATDRRGGPAGAPTRRDTIAIDALLHREESPIDATGAQRLRELHGSYAGRCAVVIGNGPSLNDTDLGLLRGHATFGVNSIFLAEDRLPEPLTFYTVEDTAVFFENLDRVRAQPATWRLFPTTYRDHIDRRSDHNTIFFRMNAGFYGRDTGSEGHARFSLDVPQRIFCGQSVTLINLQLAHWLGFSRVVLIGMDFDYSIPADAEQSGSNIVSRGADPNHFHPDYFGPGKTWKDPRLDRVLVNYRLAHEMFRATGREIVNATVGGRLEEFPRADLAAALDSGGGGS